LGLTVFVVLVVLGVFAEAFTPRKRPIETAPVVPEAPEDLSFVLRSGLAPIRGYAEILGDRVANGNDQRMARAIEHHAERLTVLADRLGADRT
jgi:nitrogen-specific signal transduction histidine kinase